MGLELNALEVIFLLIAGHAVADFGLQTEFVARFKSQHLSFEDGSTKRGDLVWMHILGAHCFIHGLFVYIVLGNVWLGLAEALCHGAIDYAKSDNKFGFHTDQLLHLGCKLLWWLLWLLGLA